MVKVFYADGTDAEFSTADSAVLEGESFALYEGGNRSTVIREATRVRIAEVWPHGQLTGTGRAG